MFPPEIWNQQDNVLHEDPTTNNALESWNRTWNGIIGPNPNCWKVIDGFIGEEGQARRALVATAAGLDLHSNTGRKSFGRTKYEKIKSIMSNYGNMSETMFLQSLAAQIARTDE